MMLSDNAYNFYYAAVLEEIEPRLIGPRVIAKGEVLPPGVQEVTRDVLINPEGKAQRGRRTSPIQRVTGELVRKTIPITEHISGFTVDNQSLLASKRGSEPLPVSMAIDSARLVAESVEDMIFNGIDEMGMKGIYKHAGSTFKVDEGKEWNTQSCNPYNDIISMVSMLEETGRYSPKVMVLGPLAYRALAKTNDHGVSYFKMLEDAGIFPNGKKDIYRSPARANDNSPLIPPDGGVIGDFGKNIAERYVQSATWDTVADSAGHYSGEISLFSKEMDEDHLWHFSVQTYQGIDVHYTNAFVRLENLIKTSALKKKG